MCHLFPNHQHMHQQMILGAQGKKKLAVLAALSFPFCCTPGEVPPASKLIPPLFPKEEGLLDQTWPSCCGYIPAFICGLALCPLQCSGLLCFTAGQSETTAWLFTASLPKCVLLALPPAPSPFPPGSCLHTTYFAAGRSW